jgi:hypothetical protein
MSVTVPMRIAEGSNSPIHLAAAHADIVWYDTAVFPEGAACAQVQRRYVAGWLRNVHHAIDYERSCLKLLKRIDLV